MCDEAWLPMTAHIHKKKANRNIKAKQQVLVRPRCYLGLSSLGSSLQHVQERSKS